MHRNPLPTVDVLLERDGALLLVKRKYDPPGWALPGGFVDYGEKVGDAAVREAREETGLDVTLTALLHVYSDPRRDPRKHTITTAFVATAEGEPVGSDDAAEARFFPLDALPSPIAFDHAAIIADFVRFRATGERPGPHV
ncbi:MAG: NUDIX domain-containing protein [Myxococcota bacterium]